MPKSQSEKLLEKQHRDQMAMEKKRQSLQEKMHRDEKRIQIATAIVQNQLFVAGLRILDNSAEVILQCLLEKQTSKDSMRIEYTYTDFPKYLQNTFPLEIEKLKLYGMISDSSIWPSGGTITLCPTALSYFSDKEKAHEEERLEKERQKTMNVGDISNSMVFIGDMIGSNISIDNSFQRIKNDIDEKGGEDTVALLTILDDVKELVDNMKTSRSVPKQTGLFNRINSHLEKHGWFYGEIIGLLGTTTLQLLSGNSTGNMPH